jgi:hypothetical protein
LIDSILLRNLGIAVGCLVIPSPLEIQQGAAEYVEFRGVWLVKINDVHVLACASGLFLITDKIKPSTNICYSFEN